MTENKIINSEILEKQSRPMRRSAKRKTDIRPDHKKYIREYVKNGGNGTAAAKKIWPALTPQGATVKASRILSNDNVQRVLLDISRAQGVDENVIMAKLNQIIMNDDRPDQLNAIRTATRLYGWDVQRTQSQSVQVSVQLRSDEIRKMVSQQRQEMGPINRVDTAPDEQEEQGAGEEQAGAPQKETQQSEYGYQ